MDANELAAWVLTGGPFLTALLILGASRRGDPFATSRGEGIYAAHALAGLAVALGLVALTAVGVVSLVPPTRALTGGSFEASRWRETWRLGIDGLSLWPLVLLSLMQAGMTTGTGGAINAGGVPRPPSALVGWLFFQTAVALTWTTPHALVGLCAATAALGLLLVSLSREGGANRRAAAQLFGGWASAGLGAWLLGCLCLAAAVPTILADVVPVRPPVDWFWRTWLAEIPRWTGRNEPALSYWQSVSSVAFLGCAFGALILWPATPFAGGLAMAWREASPATQRLFVGGWLPLGAGWLCRYALPYFPDEWDVAFPLLLTLLGAGSLVHAMLSWVADDRGSYLLHVLLADLQLAALACLTLDVAGAVAGVLLMMGSLLTVLSLIGGEPAGPRSRSAGQASLSGWGVGSAAGWPLSVTFWGRSMTLFALFGAAPMAGLVALTVWGVLVAAAVRRQAIATPGHAERLDSIAPAMIPDSGVRGGASRRSWFPACSRSVGRWSVAALLLLGAAVPGAFTRPLSQSLRSLAPRSTAASGVDETATTRTFPPAHWGGRP